MFVDPATVILPVPKMLKFPELGVSAPPEFPVIVCIGAPPVPASLTNPLASTEKSALEKAAKPIFVASVEAIAWDI